MGYRAMWRYPLTTNPISFTMPAGAKIRHVAKRTYPEFWAEVSLNDDSSYESEQRRFVVFGTGFSIRDGYEYVGTFFAHGGDFVGHIFEVT
jgi:hypothetical protein